MSQRRSVGGARREATERVVIRGSGAETEAWTLNMSRGGVRVVLEEPITVGAEYQVVVGEREARPARVAWVRDEADGQIAGMQFLDVDGSDVSDAAFADDPDSTVPPAQ